MWLLSILQGLSSGMRMQESLLYRHPYRNAAEALRGDAKRIGDDIKAAMEQDYE